MLNDRNESTTEQHDKGRKGISERQHGAPKRNSALLLEGGHKRVVNLLLARSGFVCRHPLVSG
jgi:hypothetical protein